MAEKWEIVKKPFEREIVREVEYGVFAKNGKELVANVTSRKDARLIAASPLMLEALEAVYPHLIELDDMPDVYSSGRVNQNIVEQVKAAIAAAKGE